jgi:hypothetical protein
MSGSQDFIQRLLLGDLAQAPERVRARMLESIPTTTVSLVFYSITLNRDLRHHRLHQPRRLGQGVADRLHHPDLASHSPCPGAAQGPQAATQAGRKQYVQILLPSGSRRYAA